MDKDYDREEFENFMNSLQYDWQMQALENRANTFDIIETHDEIDEAVRQMTKCPKAVAMLESIGVKC